MPRRIIEVNWPPNPRKYAMVLLACDTFSMVAVHSQLANIANEPMMVVMHLFTLFLIYFTRVFAYAMVMTLFYEGNLSQEPFRSICQLIFLPIAIIGTVHCYITFTRELADFRIPSYMAMISPLFMQIQVFDALLPMSAQPKNIQRVADIPEEVAHFEV